jgi:hypothetical protein
MARPKRPDPRGGIVDGDDVMPYDIAYRLDLLTSMRDYFAEIYGNKELFFDLDKVSDETLKEWLSKHVSFYNEAQQLVNDCIDLGHIFDPEEINKLKDYHLQKSQMLTSMLMDRANEAIHS